MASPRAAVGADGHGRDVTPRCPSANPGEAAQPMEAGIFPVPEPLIQKLVVELNADTLTEPESAMPFQRSRSWSGRLVRLWTGSSELALRPWTFQLCREWENPWRRFAKKCYKQRFKLFRFRDRVVRGLLHRNTGKVRFFFLRREATNEVVGVWSRILLHTAN